MKHIFLTAALALGALAAQAQQGSFYVGGQAGFNSTTTTANNSGTSATTSKLNNYSFSPEVGTFFTNQVQFGVGFTFSGSKQENPNATVIGTTLSTTINRYGGTVYSRYFFGEGNFRPFVGVNVSLLPGNSTIETVGRVTPVTTESSTLDFGANINAGFGYGLTKRLTVVGSFGTFGYQSSTSKEKGTDNKITTTNFGLNANTLGNLFTVGVYYTFRAPNNNN
ncbi:outer membrane beta-barrel protein [Hymenobacter sp. RP-2-7]|uniref:Outer membrane beta-barrel protein n=1 Tax=Hymenobacter polaris TaxID=2682546 RepID=A0A7Y0FN04_9BACT|nr:outer membrane beta-barrel protein [Hymenobacter polaris]NML65970.1 outer membrane beta-barrel protein [Hymenobacter polaris]